MNRDVCYMYLKVSLYLMKEKFMLEMFSNTQATVPFGGGVCMVPLRHWQAEEGCQ